MISSDDIFNTIFSFEDLAQNHSETSRAFLNSVNRAMISSTGSSASSASIPMISSYFLSREWQQLFPSLLESLDKFDSLSTSSPFFPVTYRELDQQTISDSSVSDSSASSPAPMAMELPILSIASRILASQATTESFDEIDITPYLCMPQAKASQILRIRPSKLSAQWRIAANSRKWPFREVKRLDREIFTLVKNLEVNPLSVPLIGKLQKLLKDREALLVPVKIANFDRNFNETSHH